MALTKAAQEKEKGGDGGKGTRGTKRGGIGGVTALWRMTLMPGGMSNLREIAHQGGRHVRAQRRDMGEGHRTEIQ